MTEEGKPDERGRVELDVVHCRRTGQEYHVDKHQQCPYCYGEDKDIATGDHAQFCDFQPGKDPVSFGFPEDVSRHQRG